MNEPRTIVVTLSEDASADHAADIAMAISMLQKVAEVRVPVVA